MALTKSIEFLGFAADVLRESGIFFTTLVRGRTRFGARAFRAEFVVMAVQPLPIVSLVAVSLGLILASQAVHLLDMVNLEAQMGQLIVVSLVREFAPIVTGIFVAGRGGLALAVHLGAMVQRREVDALVLMDISRLRFVVAPTFCVSLLSMTLLTLWFAVLSVMAAAEFLRYWRQTPVGMFIGVARDVLSWTDLTITVGKSLTIGALVVIVAAFNGLGVERDARGLSRVATATVVQALLIVILVQLVFSLARA